MAVLTVLAVLLSSCGSAAPAAAPTAAPAAAPTAAPAAAATTAPAAAPTAAPADAATTAPAASGAQLTIGISMPTKSSARWISDGENMVKVFTEMGYKTNLQYAEDDIPNQVAQLENMITTGVNALV